VPCKITEDVDKGCFKYLNDNLVNFHGIRKIIKRKNLVFLVRAIPYMVGFLKNLNKYVPLKGTTLIYSIWRGYEKTYPTNIFLEIG
jgi:hypothetical protein